MNKAIVCAAGPVMWPLLECAMPTFERFADEHQYELVINRDLHDAEDYRSTKNKAVRWGKVAMLKEVAESYDLALWMDADSMFTSFDRDVADDVPKDCFQALTLEQSPRRYRRGFNPNTGVWALRTGERGQQFMVDVLAIGIEQTGIWAEQEAVSKVLGWEMKTDSEGNHISKPVHPSGYLRDTGWLPAEWNPTGLAARWPSRVLHFAGYKNADRLPLMRQELRRLEYEGLV
jgi:hypothetical protein